MTRKSVKASLRDSGSLKEAFTDWEHRRGVIEGVTRVIRHVTRVIGGGTRCSAADHVSYAFNHASYGFDHVSYASGGLGGLEA